MMRKDYILVAAVLNSVHETTEVYDANTARMFREIVEKFSNHLDVAELDFTHKEFMRMCYA